MNPFFISRVCLSGIPVATQTDVLPTVGQRGAVIHGSIFFYGTKYPFIQFAFSCFLLIHNFIVSFFPGKQQIYFSDELHRMKLESKSFVGM